MKIPQTYSLGGIERTVRIVDSLESGEFSDFGEYNPSNKEIIIANYINKKRIKKEEKEQTYLHELIHAILDVMGENKLYHNEKFVHTFSTFLYESLKSAK